MKLFLAFALALSFAQPANADPVQARTAASFGDSVGFNSHFNYTGSPYDLSFDKIAALLIAAHAHHLRDGGWRPTPTDLQRYGYLGAHGIMHSAGFDVQDTQAQIVDALNKYYPYVDFIEPSNEYDGYRFINPLWANDLQTQVPFLKSIRDADPRYKNITVLGPAMTSLSDYQFLGNLEPSQDAGNLHASTCDLNPGNTDGSGHNGFPFEESYARLATPTQPIWTSEVGFNDKYDVIDCAIPQTVIAKYDPRMIVERFIAPENQGSARTYFYQLVDMPTDVHFGNEGLIDANGNAKIQWTAVSSLLRQLADNGTPFAPGTLDYTITGATPQTHTLLLQQHGGRFSLLIWQEMKSWQSNDATRIGGHAIDVPPITVTLTANTTQPRALYTYRNDWKIRGVKIVPNAAQTYSIPVTDTISIISF